MKKSVFCILLAISHIMVANALASNPTQNLSVSVTVEYEADQQGVLELKSGDNQEVYGRLTAPLPEGFLMPDVSGIILVEATAEDRPLSAQRMWLRSNDSSQDLTNVTSTTLNSGQLQLEYRPASQDLPGTYRGRLIARSLTGNKALDILVEIPPFVHHEVRRQRLGRDLDGNPTGQFEILVTSNARQWSLSYRLETPGGGKPCTDLHLGTDSASGSWEVAADGLRGVISGRGPIQDRLLVLVPQGSTGLSSCDAVVVIEKTTAR